ncbi:MAG: DM13 domain-containing protein [Bacteroidota bacterium]
MRFFLLLTLLTLAACGTDTAPASDPPISSSSEAAEADGSAEEMEENMSTEVMAEPAMADPEVLGEGTFAGASGHDVEGRALLYRLDDGSHVVRLEGLDSDNGPDLRVWLVTDLDDKTNGPIDLGTLKSTRGDQNYTVPADADVSNAAGVSVWCRAFSVEFGTATL